MTASSDRPAEPERPYTRDELRRALDLIGADYTEDGLDAVLPPPEGGTWLMPMQWLALLSLVSDRVLATAHEMMRDDPAASARFEKERERIRTTRKL